MLMVNCTGGRVVLAAFVVVGRRRQGPTCKLEAHCDISWVSKPENDFEVNVGRELTP